VGLSLNCICWEMTVCVHTGLCVCLGCCWCGCLLCNACPILWNSSRFDMLDCCSSNCRSCVWRLWEKRRRGRKRKISPSCRKLWQH
jgi:hypothetical protein